MTTGSLATSGSQLLSYSLYISRRGEHLAGGRFASPLPESEFVAEHEFQRCAPQRAIDGLAGDLLPPGSSFLVAHEEVLVVDAGNIKMQLASVDEFVSTPDRCDTAFNKSPRWARRRRRH